MRLWREMIQIMKGPALAQEDPWRSILRWDMALACHASYQRPQKPFDLGRGNPGELSIATEPITRFANKRNTENFLISLAVIKAQLGDTSHSTNSTPKHVRLSLPGLPKRSSSLSIFRRSTRRLAVHTKLPRTTPPSA